VIHTVAASPAPRVPVQMTAFLHGKGGQALFVAALVVAAWYLLSLRRG
jgi:hypothetical protein